MLNYLKEKNKDLALYDIYSEEFSEYGRVISDIDVSQTLAAAKHIPLPKEGTVYLPSVPQLEACDEKKQISDRIFGTLDVQIGYCCGYSSMLNAAEWHFSSELNVAITPLVLILGKRSDIRNGWIDSGVMKAFYVPEGAAIEIYATTLHFCPCQISDSGFGCVVGLPTGTNTPLDECSEDPLLFRKNKWILAHRENEALISRGVVPGINGENYKIEY